MLKLILNYLSQDSTWKGIIGVLTSAGVITNPALAPYIIAVGMGAIGIVNILVNQNKTSQPAK